MRRKTSLVGVTGLCAVLGAAASVNGQMLDRQTEVNGLIPVVVVLKEQVPPFDVELLRGLDKQLRRQIVVSTLQQKAQNTQGGILAELQAARDVGNADNIWSLWLTNAVAAHVTPELEAALAARDDVAFIHREVLVGREVFPTIKGDDVVTAAIECGVSAMNAPQVWATGNTGQGVVVGVIDTGTCLTHPDIKNQLWMNPGEIPGNGIDDDGNGFIDDVYGWNFANNNNNVNDNEAHGSHVAGTVAGDGTQGTQCGMAPDALIMTLKFFNNIQGGEVTVWNGMQYGVANGADILTASLGWLHAWNPARATWRQICENTFASGVVVVFAAGNEGSSFGIDSVRTPGDVPDMITVGATNCSMNIASFSSRGPTTWSNVPPYNDWPYPPGKLKPTISAPGENTISHNFCNNYTQMSGTSMATPHVSGGIALILKANPKLDHYDVKQILKDTAIDRGTAGPDNTYGYGFVDIFAAVKRAEELACTADLNGDTVVNSLDLLQFLNWYTSGNSKADWNKDGTINSLDVLAFLTSWVDCQ
ncbi:MAG: S8 family serine peptidase [Phycisphaeraceae bacterium]|nr:S8 family serine peptidase [Phycisphaeraceae bacterium]